MISRHSMRQAQSDSQLILKLILSSGNVVFAVSGLMTFFLNQHLTTSYEVLHDHSFFYAKVTIVRLFHIVHFYIFGLSVLLSVI